MTFALFGLIVLSILLFGAVLLSLVLTLTGAGLILGEQELFVAFVGLVFFALSLWAFLSVVFHITHGYDIVST